MKNSNRFLVGLLIVLSTLTWTPVAYATIYTAGSLLQIGDVQSKHILNATITDVDIATSSEIQSVKIRTTSKQGANLISDGSHMVVSTSTFMATTTNTLYIIGGTIAATSTSLNGVNMSWPSTAGTAGQALVSDGVSAYSYASVGGKFGGNGADGALSISAGTTTLDCGLQSVCEKNYTSISITGTGHLAFSNPATPNGTLIILRSQGAVTLTCTTIPCIDASSMGAAGGAGCTVTCSGTTGSNGGAFYFFQTNAGTAGTPGVGGALPTTFSPAAYSTSTVAKYGNNLWVGSGGGGGGNADGANSGKAGGPGGAGLVIEVGTALNFTGSIFNKGGDGLSGSGGNGNGGGGGAGGLVKILYNSLTSKSGAVTVTGGAGGVTGGGTATRGGGGGATAYTAGSNPPGSGNGGAGANGFSSLELNTSY